jgi:tRNA1(Val) A37 N6-methylase TrmN6
MLTIETNVLVSYILFPHASLSRSFDVIISNAPFFRRGDVLNTTV